MHLFMILCGVFHLSPAVIQTAASVKQDSGGISATVGDNVTLRCFYDSQVAMHFSWYRQAIGGGPELLSTVYKYDKPSKVFHWIEKNPRFSLQRNEGMNHLQISDLQLSDSATYFCGSSHSNIVEFGPGVFLSVKEAKQQTAKQQVVQEPASETVQPGGSVTFNCTLQASTCDGEHSVHWFKHGSRLGVLLTHGDRRSLASTPGPPPHSCIYHYQKANLSSSDSGTYYCAVASCGEVLFGNGSRLIVRGDVERQVTVLVWLSIIRTAVVLFCATVFVLVYIRKTR